MSRAFTKENDGWAFCVSRHEACLFADENGSCCLGWCKAHGEAKPAAQASPASGPRLRCHSVVGCRARRKIPQGKARGH